MGSSEWTSTKDPKTRTADCGLLTARLARGIVKSREGGLVVVVGGGWSFWMEEREERSWPG